MILIAVAIASAAAAASWVPVGVTDSRLRVFVDRASVRDVDGRRRARVRIGAPTAIVGRVVLVYQDEEIDCRDHRWRLLGYEAQDNNGHVLRRSADNTVPPPMLPAVDHTIGSEVIRTVCQL